MATTIYSNVRISHRADTLANWQANNPVLLKGEPAVVTDGTDTEKIKIGDGITPWVNLPYFKGPKGDNGTDGYTPIKGVDYFTEAEIKEIVNAVLQALPAAEGVSY